MYCEKCGNEIPEGSAFCGKCGNPVTNTYDTGVNQGHAVKKGKRKLSLESVGQTFKDCAGLLADDITEYFRDWKTAFQKGIKTKQRCMWIGCHILVAVWLLALYFGNQVYESVKWTLENPDYDNNIINRISFVTDEQDRILQFSNDSYMFDYRNWEFSYDDEGKLATALRKNKDGKIKEGVQCIQNEDGTRTEESYYNGEKRGEKIFDRNDECMQSIEYDSDGIDTVSNYDENGNLIELIVYDEYGNINGRQEYDEFGNVCYLCRKYKKGERSIQYLNEEGEIDYDTNEQAMTLELSYENNYDDFGNLISRSVIGDGNMYFYEEFTYNDNQVLIRYCNNQIKQNAYKIHIFKYDENNNYIGEREEWHNNDRSSYRYRNWGYDAPLYEYADNVISDSTIRYEFDGNGGMTATKVKDDGSSVVSEYRNVSYMRIPDCVSCANYSLIIGGLADNSTLNPGYLYKETEYYEDGSLKCITEYDENGNRVKEVYVHQDNTDEKERAYPDSCTIWSCEEPELSSFLLRNDYPYVNNNYLEMSFEGKYDEATESFDKRYELQYGRKGKITGRVDKKDGSVIKYLYTHDGNRTNMYTYRYSSTLDKVSYFILRLIFR